MKVKGVSAFVALIDSAGYVAAVKEPAHVYAVHAIGGKAKIRDGTRIGYYPSRGINCVRREAREEVGLGMDIERIWKMGSRYQWYYDGTWREHYYVYHVDEDEKYEMSAFIHGPEQVWVSPAQIQALSRDKEAVGLSTTAFRNMAELLRKNSAMYAPRPSMTVVH